MKKKSFDVKGMSCGACSARVENAVSKVDGVLNAPVNLLAGTMSVEYDEKVFPSENDFELRILEVVSKAGYEAKQCEGYGLGNWVLLDFGNVIVHVFDKENRLFYDLERIWRDGKTIEVENL